MKCYFYEINNAVFCLIICIVKMLYLGQTQICFNKLTRYYIVPITLRMALFERIKYDLIIMSMKLFGSTEVVRYNYLTVTSFNGLKKYIVLILWH